MSEHVPSSRRWRFGPFELDTESGELRGPGRTPCLPPQPCKVLAHLAARSGRVVRRDELRGAIWGEGTHVDFEHGLNFCIRQIRRALGEEAQNPVYVETLPRRGYRFLVEAEAVPEPTARRRGHRRLLSVLAALILLASGLAAWHFAAPLSQGAGTVAAPADLDADARSVYLAARYLASRGGLSGEDLRRAVTTFERAVVLAPDYAPAWSGLAYSYAELTYLGGLPAAEGYPRAQRVARRALALDEGRAEAHLAQAVAALFHDFDWAVAEREFRRALDLEPGRARGHHWHAHYLSAVGRHDDAIREAERARVLEPDSALVTLDLGWFYYLARRYDEAIIHCRQALDLEPSYSFAYDCMQHAHGAQGRTEQAVRIARQGLEAAGADRSTLAQLDRAAKAGLDSLLRFQLGHRQSQGRPDACWAFPAATYFAVLGDHDRAFAWLEVAWQERSGWLPFAAVEPRLDPLRDDPRFDRFLGRLGLPES